MFKIVIVRASFLTAFLDQRTFPQEPLIFFDREIFYDRGPSKLLYQVDGLYSLVFTFEQVEKHFYQNVCLFWG